MEQSQSTVRGSGTDTNIGVALSKDASIVSIGKGAITVTGIGGEGIGSDGIRLEDPVSRVQSNSGTINLIGTANSDSFGINLLAGSQIFSTAGDINLLSKSSTINLDNTVVINTTGNVSINQSDDSFVGSTIIGANINISANTLFLNDIIKFDYNDSIGQFDIINVTGQLDLTGATLNLDSTKLTDPIDGISYSLINNDENDAVIGTFKGLAEGAKVGTVGDYDIFITYQGSDGNDVEIYLASSGSANQDPTDLSLDSTSIDENVPDNSVVGTFSSIDLDSGDTFTYSLVTGEGDADNNAFTIDGDRLTINQSPDFEGQSNYNIRVRTTDQGGLFFEKELIITIKNLDEVAPTITSGGTTTAINENSGANQVVYTVTSTDNGDIVTGATTYSLKNVDDFAAFSIDSTSGQVKLIANPDFETKPNYSFTVVATDAANNASEKVVTLVINDLPDLGKNLTNKSDIYFGRMAPELIYALAGNDFVYGQGATIASTVVSVMISFLAV
ncbi:cadherin repeat domain-containing protein [Synechocystis sp. B12]|nr:cadherin repeat domain-containing protein [Synechocystis sp. B12]